MNNLYFIETDNNEILNIKVNEILKKNNLDINYLITYDMEEVNISDAIIDLDTYSLFNEQKIVLCKNCTFLGTSKSEIEHNIDLLEKYLNNPNPNNYLIISVDKADGKKNIVKLIKEKCQIINNDIDLVSYVNKKCQNIKIDNLTINYFLSNMGNDISRINNELDKLIEFCNSKITKDDIDLITIKKIDANIFNLIDAIIKKDKKKSLLIYQELINYGEDFFKIFITLSNQIRLIYQIKVLKDLSNDEICNILKLKNPKQVVALRYKINLYSEKELLNYLYELAIIDEKIKNGTMLPEMVIPIFIAKL